VTSSANGNSEKDEKRQPCCPTEIVFPDEAPLSDADASELEDLFKILANDTRLKLLHNLALAREMCVCDLADSLGMKPQAVSNQLQRLSDRGIVSTRRVGNNIYYRVVDTCILDLLHKAVCLLRDSADSRDGLVTLASLNR
jgi:DNA-binding transcriptional ArsR family regulator